MRMANYLFQWGATLFLSIWGSAGLMAQKAPTKPIPSDESLYRLTDEFLQSPIRRRTEANGDLFLQRSMDDYLARHFSHDAKEQKSLQADFGHDHKEESQRTYLNRFHPSMGTMRKYFMQAAQEFGVPAPLLMAYGQLQSNWAQTGESMYGSWGTMGLVENQFVQQISKAAALLQVREQQIKDDAKTNIRAAAALLASYKKGGPSARLEDWFPATEQLAAFPEASLRQSLAKRVFDVINNGAKTVSLWREIIQLEPVPVNIAGQLKPAADQQQARTTAVDYPEAKSRITACNFSSGRSTYSITAYFVHYIATGTYEGAISWFNNCNAQASTHYIIRNSDGEVTQVVLEKDRAWSQGVTYWNGVGVATEHDVLSTNLAMWDSEPMLTSAGKLINNVCNRNGIPKVRTVAGNGINGHNDVKSTSCPNLTQARWDKLLAKVAEAAGGGAPAIPVLYTVSNTDTTTGISASWKANTESNLQGYRLYYATNEALSAWALAADETVLTKTTTSITLNSSAQFKTVPAGNVYHFRLTAVGKNTSGALIESAASDVYSRSSNSGGPQVLIVDGFDRNNGSYTGATHSFATNYLKAIRDNGRYQISTAANERVADGTVNLSNYQLVVWILGDESSSNETFATVEQEKVQAYLNAGGELVVSGSEIGYDLANGTTADQTFYNNYLKAAYVGDGAANYTPASGIAGTGFDGLSLPFGVSYPEDYPDNINPFGGSVTIFNYAQANTRGGVAYKGAFGAGSAQGGIVYTSFPLETLSLANLTAFFQKSLAYLGVVETPVDVPPVAVNDAATTESGKSVIINVLANDLANGTPFSNASLSIEANPINGVATVNTNGTINYNPAAGFVGTDSLSYTVADNGGVVSNAAVVRITVSRPNVCLTNGPEVNTAFPKREMRGMWISTVSNIDWPSSRSLTTAQQQAELLRIIDTAVATGINTLLLQVRPECDALYPSSLDPWSYHLTGAQGTAPSPLWDPLQFAIDAAHARGLELHAWLNPYRAKQSTPTLSPQHVLSKNPSWGFTVGTKTILNPGLPQVRDYVTAVVADIANRYDIDGIHFDDYFYPYDGMSNEDAAAFSANNPNGLSLADWRRDNVNKLVAMVYDRIQLINTQKNANIKFGISPFGIYKSGVPAGITGMSSYDVIYCDPLNWLQNGKVDYLAPQLYWPFGGAQDYAALSKWWNDQAAAYGRHSYPGQGLYRLADANWAATEIQNQIAENRKTTLAATLGQIFFTTNDWMKNDKNIKTLVSTNQYRYKAFAPAMPWKDGVCPVTPSNVRISNNKLMWDVPPPAADGDEPVKYVVYRFSSIAEASTNAHDGTKVLDIVVDTAFTIPTALQNQSNVFLVVSALDKNNNESVFSTPISTAPPVVNVAPVAVNDVASATQGVGVSINVLANDTDNNRNINPSTVVIVANPANGTVSVAANGTINYTANSSFAGADSLTYRVSDSTGLVSNVAKVNITVSAVATCTPTQSNIIVDEGSVGYSMSAGWVASTSNPTWQGAGYLHDNNTGKGTKWVSYSPAIAGVYDVYTWYVAGTNRATNVLYQINHNGGTTNVTINQQNNGSQWVYLGRYTYASGTANKVMLRNDGSNNFVIADAVRFAYAGCPGGCIVPFATTKIVDDAAATYTGTWAAGANAGFYGSGYRHDNNELKGSKTATFTPNLEEAGSYELQTYYVSGTNRATNIPIDVYTINGLRTVTLNQQINGSTWVSLGTFNFDKTINSKVVMRTTGTSGVVIADAFRWVYKGCVTNTARAATDVMGTAKQNAVTAYPNPFNSNVQVRIQSASAGKATLHLFDLNGKQVLSQSAQLNVGEQEVKLQGNAWLPGVYFLRVELPDGKVQTTKLIKQ